MSTSSSSNGRTAIVETTKNNNNASHDGAATLTATILSAYDLPMREPPSYITIQVGNKTVKTGPPSQRHKDRNSFKFTRESVTLHANSLPELYSGTAIVTAAYPNQNTSIRAEYELKQLKIHETVWLILQLEGVERDEDTVPPTLRLQLTLSGPYRAEIGFLVHLFEGWCKLIDAMEDSITHQSKKLPQLNSFDPKYLLIPATPLLALLVVSAPVLAGILTVTLPVALPIVVVIIAILGLLLFGGAFVYGSSRTGRSQIGSMFAPVFNTILSTKAGQTGMYQTGPRPTPVSVARVILPKGVWWKLILSLLIDGTGSASYLLPVVGEITDLGWAPIQTMLLMAMYEGQPDHNNAEWLKYVSFAEEILPFTDIVPSATIGWLLYCGIPHWSGNSSNNISVEEPSMAMTQKSRAPVYERSSATGNATVRLQSNRVIG